MQDFSKFTKSTILKIDLHITNTYIKNFNTTRYIISFNENAKYGRV